MNPNPVTEQQPLPQGPQQEPYPGPREPEEQRATAGGRGTAWVVCLVRGGLAAGLGLGAFAVLVMVLWISSPYPDAGAGAALRVAAGVWLLAHGADLVRTDTLGGVAAPVGLTPLLCSVLPLWLAHRAARDACEEGEDGEEVAPRASGWEAFGGVTVGYLLVGALAAVYAAGGPLPATVGSVVLHVPLVVGGAAAVGVWTAYGRPHGPLPRWVPAGVRAAFARPLLATAARAAAAGTAVLVGGGALVVGVSLGWHADLAQESFVRLAGEWSGRFGVLALALALVPNAAVWGACYGVGVGFEVGVGATVGPLGAVGAAGAVPHFPLLAALPGEGRGTAVNWAASGVPLVAAVVVAWLTVRVAAPVYSVREEAWGRRQTAGAVILAGVGCGAMTAVLAAASGGPLGVERLAAFGPVGWAAGLGVVGWVVGVGVPVALGVRGWRVRERRVWRVVASDPVPGPVAAAASASAFPGFAPVASASASASPAFAPDASASVSASPGFAPDTGEQATPLQVELVPVPPVPLVPPAPPGQGMPGEGGAWHDSGAREVRWAALREASGGLMAEVREEGEGVPPSAGDHPSPPLP
ncbi:DUF6350 family protein [Streptomyces sp. NBC_00237]|uniref:cell division protein PerM n=1 Tax=Streptomyces sp. NBC_00237 TaxID=2975687 RepID=UPI0022525DA8|nr:DUF6350 family protein [Streptomyces sp. NBC_00237]MCX5204723.1 DUF6350 family protein [Streptomyces sp. NBC_00237]